MINIFSVTFAAIAVIVAIVSALITKTSHDMKEHRDLYKKIDLVFDEFSSLFYMGELISFKYDFENAILIKLFKNELVSEDFNILQKNVALLQNRMEKAYHKTIRLMSTLSTEKNGEFIKPFNILVNDMYKYHIEYTNALFDFYSLYMFIKEQESFELLENNVKKIYDSIYELLSRFTVLCEYYRSFEICYYKTTKTRKAFYLNKKSKDYILFQTIHELVNNPEYYNRSNEKSENSEDKYLERKNYYKKLTEEDKRDLLVTIKDFKFGMDYYNKKEVKNLTKEVKK